MSGELGRPPAVEAVDLAASYGGRPVWAGATFSVPAGSFAAVLGPNGAGKSTLLSLLLGLHRPSAGELSVLGERPRRGNPAIGYVPQGASIQPDQSIRGRDYVGLGLDGHRWGVGSPAGRRRRRDLVARAIASVVAEPYADRRMGSLSGGERQRLALAQALVGDTRLVLLDEPLANLDVRSQAAVVRLVADLARSRGVTVLLVAHDVNPLLAHLDLAIYLARGRVAAGPVDRVIDAQTLSRIYDAPVEVIRDSRSRLFVVGLEEEVGHPHP